MEIQKGKDLKEYFSTEEAYDAIEKIYDHSIGLIEENYSYIANPDHKISEQDKLTIKKLLENDAVYPYIEFQIRPENLCADPSIEYGVAQEPGDYGTTLTQPRVFKQYLIDQISQMIDHHKCGVYVGKSHVPIPLSFALETSLMSILPEKIQDIKEVFPSINIKDIHDNVSNGVSRNKPGFYPLSLFSALRMDYSLGRLHHYTGTHPSHFQNFILLTNYHRYIENFARYALEVLGEEYTQFVEPGNHITHADGSCEGTKASHLPQMPAYHLKRPDGNGITFINIGVGPSNAKNITDNLAVLRPHCWIMLGHCAGLRRSQQLGDYVLAHGYVRHDHVLDSDLPPWVNIPALAEIQVSLQQAVSEVLDLYGGELKTKLRTGTVLGTDNRNWELQYDKIYETFQQHRAIAVDMESATLAANGFRFRVPYGTLLCVSDKPLHGEIKLKATANSFYNDRIHEHLQIGLKTIEILRSLPSKDLHSRKLRGFEEPPFR